MDSKRGFGIVTVMIGAVMLGIFALVFTQRMQNRANVSLIADLMAFSRTGVDLLRWSRRQPCELGMHARQQRVVKDIHRHWRKSHFWYQPCPVS